MVVQLVAGEQGSVLRARMRNFSVSACLEELWKDSLAQNSSIVAMYGNSAISIPSPPEDLMFEDEETWEEANTPHRVTAALLVATCTSAWVQGRLCVSGEQPWHACQVLG